MNNSEEIQKKLILALETGIDGGSAAIMNGNKALCSAEGSGSVSRSEDLLLLVEGLLEKHNLSKNEIGIIAVNDSPGSATGLRIGLATAVGVGNSLSAKVFKCSVLKAQVIISGAKQEVISAVHSEKNGFFYRKFRETGGVWSAETEILNERDPTVFMETLSMENRFNILDEKLAKKLSSEQDYRLMLEQMDVQIIVGNLAECIGLAATTMNASDNKVNESFS